MNDRCHSLLRLIAGSTQKKLTAQIRYLKVVNQIPLAKLAYRALAEAKR